MPRGPVFIIIVLLLVIGGGYFVIPFVKRSFLGNSLQTRIKILAAEDDPKAQRGDEIIPKTILELEIYFPMGAAPEKIDDLNVIDENNQPVEVIWKEPIEKEDLPDQALTRWRIREVYFPMGFRQGTLREKQKELQYFKVPQVPFNAGS